MASLANLRLRHTRVRIPEGRAKTRYGPAIRIYRHDGEEQHVVYSPDGTPQLYGDESYVMSHFGPQHGLSPTQVLEADRLWRLANRRRPIPTTSYRGQLRLRLRMAGIISAIKRNTVGNSTWGKRLHGYRGGRVMAMHGLHILWANGERAKARYSWKRAHGLKGH